MSPLGRKVSARGGEKPPSTLYFRVVHPPLVTRRFRSTHFEGPSQNISNPPTPASQAQLPLTAVVEFCSVSSFYQEYLGPDRLYPATTHAQSSIRLTRVPQIFSTFYFGFLDHVRTRCPHDALSS